MKVRQSKFHSPYSTVFRPEFAHLDLNKNFTNDFEVTVCSLLCVIGLHIPLFYSLGRTDAWNQQVLFINWTFLNYLYTQGEIQQLKHWYQTENWGTNYLMCCLEVEVWLFLKREFKTLLKSTESDINVDIRLWCLCVYINRIKEWNRERGREERVGAGDRSHNQFHNILSSWMLSNTCPYKSFITFSVHQNIRDMNNKQGKANINLYYLLLSTKGEIFTRVFLKARANPVPRMILNLTVMLCLFIMSK